VRHSFIDEHSALPSPVHRLEPRAKIIVLFALILVCVTTPPEGFISFAGCLAFLAVLLAASLVPPGHVLTRSLWAVPFALAVSIFLPFMKTDCPGGGWSLGVGALHVSRSGLTVLLSILLKAWTAAFAAALLTATTPFPDLLRGLERLRVPRVFLMLAAFTYRYLFLLVDEAERMARARDSRSWSGRWLWQARAVGQMIGVLFLRSYERAERVYAAMLSRGFDGRAVTAGDAALRARDWTFIIISLLFLIFLRWTAPHG
jgi:cobalt/nickel transport system permease protein